MIPLKTIYQHLARPEVTEVAMVSGRHPFARVGASLEVLDTDVVSSDDILQLLFNAGGSRYVDSLGPKAMQWATRADGVGAVLVAALMKGDTVQARFTLRNRDASAAEGSSSARAAEEPARKERSSSVPQDDSSRRDRVPRPLPTPVAPPPAPTRPRAVPEAAPPLMGSTETSFDFQLDDQRPPSTPASPLPRVAPIVPTTPAPKPAPKPAAPAPAPVALNPRGRRATLDDPFGEAVVRPPPAAPARPPSAPPVAASPPEPPSAAFEPSPRPPSSQVRAAPEPPASSASPSASPRAPSRRSASTAPEAREPEPAAAPRRSTPASRPAVQPEPALKLRSPGPGHHSRVFRDLLFSARSARASDLHIVAQRKPLLRISGEMVGRGNPLDPELCEHMILERVPPRLLGQLERDGSCDFALEDPRAGRFRVNVTRQRTGFKASLRLIGQEIPTLASLGLPDAIGLATHHHQGLIVLTGPTGHGKTTTLAAIVDVLNSTTTRHIITVEDPVEYIHPRKMALMSQREVGTHTRSFGSALKGSLREDPDVIVVGELRDTETVRMALSASETGHLVIGTMNTPSAAKTIDRLIDLFPPGDQQQVRITLAGGLRMIVSQRLLPSSEGPGMVAAAEVLPGSTALWNLIRDSKTFQIPSLQQRGKGLGIIRLDDSLAELVRAGKTSAEAAIRLAEAPEELSALLSGKRAAASAPGAPPPPPSSPSTDAPPPSPRSLKGLFNKAGAFLGKRGG
jgi:twitching motility protein PilT